MKMVLRVVAAGAGLALMSVASASFAQTVSTADQIADRLLNEQTTEVEEPVAAEPAEEGAVPALCLTDAGELPENAALCATKMSEADSVERGGMGTAAEARRDRGATATASRAAPAPARVRRVSAPSAAPVRRPRPAVVNANAGAAASCAIEDTGDTNAANLCLTFALGSSELTPRSRQQLDELKVALETRLSSRRARLEGFADSVGDAEANLRLSQARAEAARAYLVAAGLDAGRLQVDSFGDTRPIDGRPGTDPTNRRVEFRLEN